MRDIEVIAKLKSYGYPQELIDQTVDFLVELEPSERTDLIFDVVSKTLIIDSRNEIVPRMQLANFFQAATDKVYLKRIRTPKPLSLKDFRPHTPYKYFDKVTQQISVFNLGNNYFRLLSEEGTVYCKTTPDSKILEVHRG